MSKATSIRLRSGISSQLVELRYFDLPFIEYISNCIVLTTCILLGFFNDIVYFSNPGLLKLNELEFVTYFHTGE